MDSNIVSAVAVAGPAVSHGLHPWDLFMNADWIVKSVMLMLLAASVWCWTIIFEKLFNLRRLNGLADRFEASFWSGGAVEDLYDRIHTQPPDPLSAVFVAAMREWRRFAAKHGDGAATATDLADRVERVMQLTANRELDRVERYMTFLASTGSTAPFVGLFGTVWGIMNSFSAIGATKNTSLAVVAPGIAEALFATALGLLAAIPAVLAYNKLSRDLDRYAGRINGFAGEFMAILSRQLEDRR
ncbi:protein TolQ [Defluviicoccus vanus]|uniref:Tol-Pal system protein TolQ n=1 Tax=Defluviicoccus vanus TaxID=111831 RepID=A0A7H1N6T1_9PROT|nr:protein TolQ [Defluviicoccus vanus]QNT71417.1 protein TolQ [Defluviicoccus vanus]